MKSEWNIGADDNNRSPAVNLIVDKHISVDWIAIFQPSTLT